MEPLNRNVFRACLLLCSLFLLQSSAQSTFQIAATGFSAEQQTALEFAARRWAQWLVTEQPIKINAYLTALPPSVLGICLPNGRKDFAAAAFSETWYPTALANALSGTELNAGEFDMDIYINATAAWYWDTTGAVPAGLYDFVSVAMHEIGHGLGFVSLSKVSNGQGSIGLLQPADFFPLVTSFPWPALDSLPGIFDRLVTDAGGQWLTDYENPSAALADALQSGLLYFSGPKAFAANNGPVRLYAPPAFALGSSVLHLNESSYPTGHPDELMTPFAAKGKASHSIGPVTWAMLADMGWQLNPLQGIAAELTPEGLTLFPTLTSGLLHISSPYALSTVVVINAFGQAVLQTTLQQPMVLNLGHLPAGCYLLAAYAGEKRWQRRFVLQRR